jgi:signal transduction histidine kinase/ActR/RegA family two-component response regulator
MPTSNTEERVVIIAPVGQDAEAMATLLAAEGFQTEIFSSLADAREGLLEAGTLLLTEEALELTQMSEFLETLKAQPPWSELPVIILTRGGESHLVKMLDLIAEAAGSLTLLERPMRATTLSRSVQVALRSRRRQYQARDLLIREQVMRSEAETANQIKDEFLATVSHELRTPLNAILGWATLIRRDNFDNASLPRAIQVIERNARAQAQLIEDLLDVSRMISGKLRLNAKPIELISVIRAAIDSVQPAAEAKGVHLEMVLDIKADRVFGDANRLQQVVWNLLSNAIKFTPKGGRVQVKLERIDSHARIIVNDTGAGISSEFLPHVFEAFRQADGTTTKRQGGLGLGLAIAHRLVEMHGGTLSVASEGEGLGASFTMSIPIETVQTASQAFADSTKVAIPDSKSFDAELPSLSGLRILAVDDEVDTRDMVRGVLEEFGADVVTAGSAKEAVDALRGWQPDVIICDIGMPGEDGYALIRQVREMEAAQRRNTPAIALTGYVRIEDRMRALAAGFQMFLPKPVEANELVITIANLIEATSGERAMKEGDIPEQGIAVQVG